MKVQEAYNNLEKIITHGFLSVRMEWRGLSILLKSMTDKEYDQMRMLCDEKDFESSKIYSLCFCTAFLGHNNAFELRKSNFEELVNFYKELPDAFMRKVAGAVREINNKYLESVDYLEGFSYTRKSRYLWKIFDPMHRSEHTGISGIECTGLNSVQENWIAINKGLDDEDEYEKDLNLHLLTAGSMNSKGANAVQKNFQARKNEMQELREEIARYGYDKKRQEENTKKREQWTAPLKSKEDLVKELERQMKGHKDRHDLFIDEWVRRQSESAERAKEEAERKRRAFREQVESVDWEHMEESKPVTAEEMERLLDKRSERPGAGKYMSAYEDKGKKERVIKKLSTTVIGPERGSD